MIYNGNNYAEEWVVEAAKRGLPNIKSWIDSLKEMDTTEAQKLFSTYKVLSKRETESRYEIYVESYVKHINIEAQTAITMAKTLYIPAVVAYTKELAETVTALKAAGAPSDVAMDHLLKISDLLKSAVEKLGVLESETEEGS